MPWGELKRALVPLALVVPERPGLPATVVTTPPAVILRIVWLPASQTKTLPEASTASPAGALKRAALPVASVAPVIPALPARVVTTPAGVILRIVWLPVSAT